MKEIGCRLAPAARMSLIAEALRDGAVREVSDPLYQWSTLLGLAPAAFLGGGWTADISRLHPLAHAAYRGEEEKVRQWLDGGSPGTMPYGAYTSVFGPINRGTLFEVWQTDHVPSEQGMAEHLEAYHQAAGFWSKVLDISDGLRHNLKPLELRRLADLMGRPRARRKISAGNSNVR